MHAETLERRFDALVAGLYRAATGDLDWSDALTAVGSAFGARAVVLHGYDLRNGGLRSLVYGRNDPQVDEAVLTYSREWHLRDPRKQHAMALGADAVGRWLHCVDYLDDARVHADPFFRQYMLGYGGRFNSNVTLPVTPELTTAFVLELPPQRGPLDADERIWCDRLGRHLLEALRAYERVRKLASQALAGHQLLAAFPHPMWLVDTDRFVLHANPAAEAEVQSEAIVAVRAGRLFLRGDRADQAIAERLVAVASGRHGTRAVIDARRRTTDPHSLLHLQAIRPVEALGAFGERPLVLATLFAPDRRAGLDPLAVGDVFGLTPAQARVAVLLSEGLTAAEVAARLGVAPTTIRSHVRSVTLRLGVARVVDAVSLLREGHALWSRAGQR